MAPDPASQSAPAAPHWASRLIGLAASNAKSASHFSQRFRVPLIAVTLGAVAIAIVVAFARLELDPARLDWSSLAKLALVLTPLTLIHAAWGMRLLASCARLELGWFRSIRTSALATVAELLPIPGGAVVRTGALVNAGAGLATSTLLVTGTAILWISLAALGAGLALATLHPVAGLLIALGGAGSSGLVLVWLGRTAGLRIAAATLVHRLIGLAIIAIRLQLSFAVIHSVVGLGETMPFALATIVGTASSLVPGGLGVSELLAGMVATLTSVDPASGLLAVAINRLVGTAATALFVLAFEAPSLVRRRTLHV